MPIDCSITSSRSLESVSFISQEFDTQKKKHSKMKFGITHTRTQNYEQLDIPNPLVNCEFPLNGHTHVKWFQFHQKISDATHLIRIGIVAQISSKAFLIRIKSSTIENMKQLSLHYILSAKNHRNYFHIFHLFFRVFIFGGNLVFFAL